MLIAVVLLVLIGFYLFTSQPKFGVLPKAERLQKMKASPNFSRGKFGNLSPTPDLTEGANYATVMKEFIFGKKERNKPAMTILSQKTNLHALEQQENVLVWFGHSSYFIQVDGKKFLIDPVLGGAASPIRFTTRSFPGTDVYAPDDFPEIDCLLISHDHWDHLDYDTIVKLKPKIRNVITGLGTGAHFEKWGFDAQRIVEKDWNETVELGGGFAIHTTAARHFSGRGFKRNRALWLSFVLQTPNMKLFLGGDSGYDAHFAAIGKAFGPFDLAILECGQYNKNWKYIHLLPEQMIPAARDLNAKMLMPVHWGKFSLAMHAWDEPIIKVTQAARAAKMPLLTPMIGEKVNLDQPKMGGHWWENIN